MSRQHETAYQVEWLAPHMLRPYPYNSRTHSAEQVAQIAASLREFGWTNPLLIDDDGTLIAGHGRLLAAESLGLSSVPCIRLGHLDADQRRAYVIADNQLALKAGWDLDMLRLELGDLKEVGFDLALTGFDEVDLEAVLSGSASATPPEGPEDTGYRLTITSQDEAEIMAVKRLLGMRDTENKVGADRVIGWLRHGG